MCYNSWWSLTVKYSNNSKIVSCILPDTFESKPNNLQIETAINHWLNKYKPRWSNPDVKIMLEKWEDTICGYRTVKNDPEYGQLIRGKFEVAFNYPEENK